MLLSFPPRGGSDMGGRCGVGATRCPEELGTDRIGTLKLSWSSVLRRSMVPMSNRFEQPSSMCLRPKG